MIYRLRMDYLGVYRVKLGHRRTLPLLGKICRLIEYQKSTKVKIKGAKNDDLDSDLDGHGDQYDGFASDWISRFS